MRTNNGGIDSLLKAKPWLSAILTVIALAPIAAADDNCREQSEDCVAVGRWNFSIALGAGARTNPLAHSDDIPLVVIPQFSYYGRRFFIDDLDVGFTLAESDSSTLNLIATPGYDRVYFYRSDLQNFFVGFPVDAYGLKTGTPSLVVAGTPGSIKVPPSPRVTYLAGPEWTFKYRGVSGQLDLLHDATGQNSGDEVRAALALPLVESTAALSANVGFTWKSAAMVNYYYGVPNFYRAGAALDPFIKLGYTLPLKGKWRLNAFVVYERLADSIADSPMISEHGVETAFVGAIYAF
jgi:outer membrane protein